MGALGGYWAEMVKTETRHDEYAEKAANDLFTSGRGETAARLQLTHLDGRFLGSWSRGPLADKISDAYAPLFDNLSAEKIVSKVLGQSLRKDRAELARITKERDQLREALKHARKLAESGRDRSKIVAVCEEALGAGSTETKR